MPNYEAMTGFANGIKEGLMAYQTMKQINRTNQMEGLLKGVQEGPNGLEFTPQKKQQMALEQARMQREQSFGDVSSPESLKYNQFAKETLGQQLPEGMSASDIKTLLPSLLAARGQTLKATKAAPSDLDNELKQARIDALKRGPIDKQPAVDFKNATELRKEYNNRPEVKTFRDVSTQYDKIKFAAANDSAAGDLSLIFGYMKMLDPGSTVREGEFANAQNAAGVPEQIINKYNQAKTGERLNPNQRKDFLRQAEGLYQSHKKSAENAKQEYVDLADLNNIRKENIFGKGLLKNNAEIQSPTQDQNLTQPSTNAHPQDSTAVQWAKQNPKDPRALTILKANGL